MSLVSGELSVDEALCDIEGDAVLERTVALYPPRVLVVPHPHALGMPGLVFTVGIPAGDVYVVHAAVVVGGTLIFVSSPGANPGVMWQMRKIASSPISPSSINCFIAW